MAAPLLVLDIGTRKVAGLVVQTGDGPTRILAARVVEHPDRSMRDGQVHRVEAVAGVVARVKQELEAELGVTLTHAAVAAAGRSLHTETARQTRRFPFLKEVTREEVLSLSLAAAQAAELAARQRPAGGPQHCVGFSPVRSWLDEQPLDDLAGHFGREIGVEVLATFLPRQVVDSLLAVLRRAGLLAVSLTLEPIAALEATIPPDLRRINLALVDVGAGTSDIALTRGGTVSAYAMVTVAGDEITERLCEHFLMDFQESERVKRLLGRNALGPIAFTTLLGQHRELTAEVMRRTLAPDVAELASAIAERILALNGSAPKAVVLVGGGSSTPGLASALASALDLDPVRVGARGPETIDGLGALPENLRGIDAVTPLGIALSAVRGRGMAFMQLTVNDAPVQLLALQSAPTLFDALLSAGIEIQKLVARPGRAVTYTLNGRLLTLPGTPGRPACLLADGRPAQLDTPVFPGLDIRITPAEDGVDAVLTPESVPRPAGPAWCVINDRHQDLELVLALQGEPAAPGQALPDRADLSWVSSQTLAQLRPEWAGAEDGAWACRVRVNGQERDLGQGPSRPMVNGRPVATTYRPRPDDRITWEPCRSGLVLKELVGELAAPARMTVYVNGESRQLDYGGSRVLMNGRAARPEDPVPDQAEIVVQDRPLDPPLLSHVLEDLPLAPPSDGRVLKLSVDGRPAGFATPLRDGARVEITFG